MLGEAALLRQHFWKTKASDFLCYCFSKKSNTELEKKEVDPCNITHAIDTIVKNDTLQQNTERKKWAVGMVVLISIIFISF